MKVDTEYLKRHYATLSDEALLEMNRDDLVAAAQTLYDEEIERRGLGSAPEREAAPYEEDEEEEGAPAPVDSEGSPGWLHDAIAACSFQTYPGDNSAPEADEARAALESAGIPCHIQMTPLESEGGQQRYEYGVMVPGPLALHATSVLDREIFNPRLEEEWRTHFEELSDEDLRTLDPKIFCAGFLDRAARLKRVYDEEMARRRGRES